MKKIFVVDGDTANLLTAQQVLGGSYQTIGLSSAVQMLSLAEKIVPDLILLAVDMPEMSGFEVMEILKGNEKLRMVPVVFLTVRQDSASELRGFEMGALDFITSPFSPPVLLKRIEHHLDRDKLIKRSQQTVRDIHYATIHVIADIVESRDRVTGGHIERTQKYLEILLNELVRTGTYADEMVGWDLGLILPSAQLHDVGKITISDLILNKPGRLTPEEFALIKRHPEEGERIIGQIISKTEDDGFLRHAQRFAGYHHEKWDGTGYPRGLSGRSIPLEGRLMAVADVYDALVSERPYKKALSHQETVAIIQQDSGTHFDPVIVRAFLNVEAIFSGELAQVRTKT